MPRLTVGDRPATLTGEVENLKKIIWVLRSFEKYGCTALLIC